MVNHTPFAAGPHDDAGDAGTSYTQAEATMLAHSMGGDYVHPSNVASTEGGSCSGRSVIDWLSASFDQLAASDLVGALESTADDYVNDKPTHEERGRTSNRYPAKLSNQGIMILHKGAGGFPGCRLDMTGEGCRQWERDHPGRSFLDLLLTLHAVGARMHRLDVAMDDFAGALDMTTLEQYRQEGFFVFKGHRDKTQYLEQGFGDTSVETIIFGSPKSNCRIKFYNRGHLLQALGLPNDPDALVGEDGWVRAEVQARNDQAQALLDRIVSLRSVAVAGAEALARVTFKDPNPDDTNLSRWSATTWWTRFLGNARRARLAAPQVTSSLRSKMAWLYRQAAPAIALLMIEEGEAGLMALANHGLRTLKPQHLALLSPEKRRQAEMAMAGARTAGDDEMSDEEMQAILADIADEEDRRAWVEEMLAVEADDEFDPDHCGWTSPDVALSVPRQYQPTFGKGGAA